MSPATGLMTFTSGMLLLRPQITHWRTTGHELGHALLGHFEDYPKTTFPVPSAANEQLIRQVGNKISARMRWLLADMARFRSFSNATMTEYFRTRFVKAAQGRANLVWGDILLALLQELQPETPQGAPPQTPQQRSYDTLENESVVLSLLALTAPDTVIEPQGKDFLTRMMSLRLDTLNQLRALEAERMSVLRQSYPPEYLSNGNEQAADFVGDWLMDRSGLHPGISAASWLAEMIVGPGIDAKQQRAFEEWQRSGDPSAALAVFPPYFLACLNHTDSGDTVWPGLETHPNDCFRFQSLLDRKGRDPALLSGDIEATLPPVSPSLDEVQEELIEAYAQAGMPLPTNLRD